MKHIGSSNIKKAGYDKVKREMSIVFINRPTWLYTYKGVSVKRWINFLKAESKGIYFAQFIKEGYPYRRTFTNGN